MVVVGKVAVTVERFVVTVLDCFYGNACQRHNRHFRNARFGALKHGVIASRSSRIDVAVLLRLSRLLILCRGDKEIANAQ